jgi:hypothetical protein
MDGVGSVQELAKRAIEGAFMEKFLSAYRDEADDGHEGE